MYKSIQRWALLTSTPIMGTSIKENNDNIKTIGEIFMSFPSLMDDKTKMIISPRMTKVRCLKKKV